MTRAPAPTPESDRAARAPHPRETLGFFGHAAAEQELLDAYKRDRLAQAWIIGGPEGVGKATLAWRFTRFLLAHPDPAAHAVQAAQTLAVPAEAPAAKQIGALSAADVFLLRRTFNDKSKKLFTEIRVDDVREIIDRLHRSSGADNWRVAIVDAADDLNKSSANALLKLIEEPPRRALFLLIANQPGRLLPTIRSRCRKIMLSPLSEAEVVDAVRALGPPFATLAQAEIETAAKLADGSIREALRLLEGEGVAFNATLQRLFDRLPQIDWRMVHMTADSLVGRDNDASFDTFMRLVRRWIDARVKHLAGQGAAQVIGFATAWDDIARAARETEIYNFDRRALVVSIFSTLARAASHVD